MNLRTFPMLAAAAMLTAACVGEDEAENARATTAPTTQEPFAAQAYGDYAPLTPEEVERGRLDPSWRQVVQLDSAAWADTTQNPETWEDISIEAVNTRPMHLPLHSDASGPSVIRVQTLLDRALFSPGVIDGRWGKNTEKAIYWLQKREGMPATGGVDQATFDRLVQLAGNPTELVRGYRLTGGDVNGPFVPIPEDIYAKAEMECMCYESLSEKLAEMFHTTPEVLRQLNPGVDLNQLTAGSEIRVLNIRDDNPLLGYSAKASVPRDSAALPQDAAGTQAGGVARVVISDRGHYVHAVDASGRILFHFPSTLGSTYDPSPTGEYQINSATVNPWWHYQPAILAHVDDSEPDARIPPGPNNAVGVVWMDLSKPHYGIHGTSAPETIGYVTSAGCVRLTNWDALFLAKRIRPGTPVAFRDT